MYRSRSSPSHCCSPSWLSHCCLTTARAPRFRTASRPRAPRPHIASRPPLAKANSALDVLSPKHLLCFERLTLAAPAPRRRCGGGGPPKARPHRSPQQVATTPVAGAYFRNSASRSPDNMPHPGWASVQISRNRRTQWADQVALPPRATSGRSSWDNAACRVPVQGARRPLVAARRCIEPWEAFPAEFALGANCRKSFRGDAACGMAWREWSS